MPLWAHTRELIISWTSFWCIKHADKMRMLYIIISIIYIKVIDVGDKMLVAFYCVNLTLQAQTTVHSSIWAIILFDNKMQAILGKVTNRLTAPKLPAA